MKKILIAFLYFLPLYTASQRMQGKNFIYAGGGYISSLYVKEAVNKKIVSSTDNHNHNCLVLNIGYQISVSDKWRIVPAFSYDHFGLRDRSVQYSGLSYMLRCDRIWKEKPGLILYSGFSGGLRVLKHFEENVLAEHSTKPVYQACLFGVDIKIYKFYLGTNIGYGASGFLNCCLKYRF